jgi:phosphoribosylformylglycinamidine synthase I
METAGTIRKIREFVVFRLVFIIAALALAASFLLRPIMAAYQVSRMRLMSRVFRALLFDKMKSVPMKIGVVVFPGSNCDHDAWYAFSHNLGQQAEFLWHDTPSVGHVDAVVLPGGFAYGDYLRCGAIAKFSPVMAAVRKFAAEGGPVLGICNGFQILVESGMLPGALLRNRGLKFVCRDVTLRVEATGQLLKMPVAHGEGCYYADERTLDMLEAEKRVVLRYVDNPNGSLRDIAGICNEGRNVMGMMPHPERAADPLMGSVDGLVILESLVAQHMVSR